MEKGNQKKPYDLNERIKRFVLEVFEFAQEIPNTSAGRNVRDQLVRSASSVGANYRAAKRSRSEREYLSKLGIVEEEADETCYWLELLMDAQWGISEQAKPMLQEANEITAIIVYLLKRGKAS